MLKWGLVPFWNKDKNPKGHINAKAETIAKLPSFRAPIRGKRCLILADGFYEWKQDEKPKQPYYFQLKSHEVFGFAGIWDHWQMNGEGVESCAIITGPPNELMAPIHKRMPVIISPESYNLWLDHSPEANTEVLTRLANPIPFPSDLMESYPVSTMGNNPRNDHPECLVPVRIS